MGRDALLDPFDGVRYRRASLYERADWYDVDYAGYKAEEPFYKMLATRYVPKGGAYVEVGAGTGRLLLAIGLCGIRAHGVEPAPAMRQRLLEKLEASRALPDGLVTVEDAEGATFTGPEDAAPSVVSFPFNGALHVTSHEAFRELLAHVHARLEDGGVFALDITTPAWEEMGLGGRGWGRVDERVHPETGEPVLTCDRCTYDEATRLMKTRYRFVVDGSPEGYELSIEQHMWTYQEVMHLVATSGFAIDMVFGDVDFAPLVEKSPRLLLAARKR